MKIALTILLALLAVMFLFFAAFSANIAIGFVFVLLTALCAFLALIIHLEIIGS